jgi:hypothetical protein
MERIQAQAAKLSQLLFDPKTAEAYKTFLVLTWEILTETALLLWLVICSVFVIAAWLGEKAIAWGRDLRTWIQHQGASEADSSEKMAATGKALLDISQTGANLLLDKAREQLGLEKPMAPEAPAAPSVAPPKSTPKAAITPPAAAKVADAETAPEA